MSVRVNKCSWCVRVSSSGCSAGLSAAVPLDVLLLVGNCAAYVCGCVLRVSLWVGGWWVLVARVVLSFSCLATSAH